MKSEAAVQGRMLARVGEERIGRACLSLSGAGIASALRATTRPMAAVILERSLLRMTQDLLVSFLEVWKSRLTLCLPHAANAATRASASCRASMNLSCCLVVSTTLPDCLWPSSSSKLRLDHHFRCAWERERARTRPVARRGFTGTKSMGSCRIAFGNARMVNWGDTKSGTLRR